MSGTLLITAKNIKETAEKMLFNAREGGVEFNSAKNITHSAGEKVEYGTYEEIILEKKNNAYHVKKIEVLDLDEGSENGGNNKKLGLIHGKKYTLRAEKFVDNKNPKDENTIKWEYSYISDNGEIVLGAFKKTGIEVTFKTDDLELCGKNITFYAYIENKEIEASLDVFHHYRFRWFDRQKIIIETGLRANVSSTIDQGASSLCGIAVVGYYFAKEQPKIYSEFILNMHRTGKAIISTNNYKVEIDKDEHLIDYKESDIKYPKSSNRKDKILTADFIFLVVLKDFLNIAFDYDPDSENSGGIVEGVTGLTLPSEVATVMKNISNYNNVIDETNLVTSKWQSASNSADELEKKITQGYKIALLIDADNFTENKIDLVSWSKPTHWVGLLNIVDNKKLKELNVTVFTWNSIRTWTVSHDAFKNGYFGYVAGK